jgi:hypothetical protein
VCSPENPQNNNKTKQKNKETNKPEVSKQNLNSLRNFVFLWAGQKSA